MLHCVEWKQRRKQQRVPPECTGEQRRGKRLGNLCFILKARLDDNVMVIWERSKGKNEGNKKGLKLRVIV